MEFRVKLPDHDWVTAEQHTLVYDGIKITCNILKQALGHTGPTYISIQSEKHRLSIVNAQDFETVLGREEFQAFTKTAFPRSLVGLEFCF